MTLTIPNDHIARTGLPYPTFKRGGMSGMGDIAPGQRCYDGSHDPGVIHCVSAADVILSALNPFSNKMTTTCSPSEQSCLTPAMVSGACPSGSIPTPDGSGCYTPSCLTGQTLDSNGNCVDSDFCSRNIGISCTTLGVGVIAIVAALVVVPLLTGR